MHSLPLPIGTAAASGAHLARDLGKVYFVNGKGYRLVKAAAAIAAAAKKVLITADSGGAPTWAVNTTTTANSANVAGVVPSGQTGSSGTTGLLENDYFLIQVSGSCDVISADAIAENGLVGTSTTAGKADDASVTAGVGAMGVALEAAAGADEDVGILLKGLI